MICPDMFCIDFFMTQKGRFRLISLSLMTAALVMGGMGTPTEPQSGEGSPLDAVVCYMMEFFQKTPRQKKLQGRNFFDRGACAFLFCYNR